MFPLIIPPADSFFCSDRPTKYCLNASLNHGGFLAYQAGLASNLVDSDSWRQGDPDSVSFRNTSFRSQFTFEWKLRVAPQGATSGYKANNIERRILGRNQTFEGADFAVGDSAICNKQIG